MSKNIVVLHFQDERSDKIWAINKVANDNNSHTVWFGRRGTKLQCQNVGSRTWSALMDSKLEKGYREVEGVTIDTENCVVVPLDGKAVFSDALPATLWYRISKQVPHSVIRDYLNITVHLLSEQDETELNRLQQLSIFKALSTDSNNGGAEYSEGPLAVLLLFGLRRYVNQIAGPNGSAEFVQIADDSNNLLPDRLELLGKYIEETCIEFFVSNGWADSTDNLHSESYLFETLAIKHSVQHYTSIPAIKKLAILMGCIDAPIDLAIIRTETKAAFF